MILRSHTRMKVLQALWIFAAIAAAEQHPDFSGTWNLNIGASDFSDKRAVAPDRLAITVHQKGDSLKYRNEREKDGKKRHFDVDLTIGESTFESNDAGVVSAAWKNNVLEITTLFNPGQDRQSDQIEIWSLSSDRKRLTDDLVVHLPKNGGDVHIRRVLDKQPKLYGSRRNHS